MKKESIHITARSKKGRAEDFVELSKNFNLKNKLKI